MCTSPITPPSLDLIADPPQPGPVAKARWTRWLRALFVVPVLVFVLSASSHLEIRCALTGLVMPACCPEAAPTLTQRPQQASIGERDCCDRTVVATDKLPAIGRASALREGSPAAPPARPFVGRRGEARVRCAGRSARGWAGAFIAAALLAHARVPDLSAALVARWLAGDASPTRWACSHAPANPWLRSGQPLRVRSVPCCARSSSCLL